MLFEKERLDCKDYFIYSLVRERAELLDTTNPDWAPSVDLGHDKIKKSVTQLTVSRNARAQKRNENKRKYDEMASSSTSRKIDEVEVVQENNYVETETSSKCASAEGLKMSGLLHQPY